MGTALTPFISRPDPITMKFQHLFAAGCRHPILSHLHGTPPLQVGETFGRFQCAAVWSRCTGKRTVGLFCAEGVVRQFFSGLEGNRDAVIPPVI